MQQANLSGAHQRPAQAFFLGWPLANLGGVNEVVRNLVHEFSRTGGVAPVVIEAIDGNSDCESQDGIPVIRISCPAIYDAHSRVKALLRFCALAPRFFRQLRAICQRYDVQVLNPHFVGLEHLSLLLFRWLGYFRGEIVLSFHGSDIRSMIQSRGIERFLARVLLRGADLLVPCSQGLGQEILLLAPECSDRIVPIPNGIDVGRFLGSASGNIKLPESFQKRRRILNIGAFEYKKGHDVLLKAFAEMFKARPDTCLIIAGQTRGEIDATRQLVTALNLNEDVLLLQDLPHVEIAALLQAAHVFVLSSRWKEGICGEGFAMALLEAAAAQKPVVSTRSCGVAELIEDGKTGTVVAPEDPHELALALTETLDNPDEARRRGKNLYDRVIQNFTWKHAHQQYLTAVNVCKSASVAEETPRFRVPIRRQLMLNLGGVIKTATDANSSSRSLLMRPLFIIETIHTRTGEIKINRYATLFYPKEAMDERTIQILSDKQRSFERFDVDSILYHVEGHEEAGQWRLFKMQEGASRKAILETHKCLHTDNCRPKGSDSDIAA